MFSLPFFLVFFLSRLANFFLWVVRDAIEILTSFCLSPGGAAHANLSASVE